MTDRVRSMRTSLDASTVTPGNTAPDVSLTTPAIVLCARAAVGSTKIPSATKIVAAIPLLAMPYLLTVNCQAEIRTCPTRLIPTKKGDPDEERGAPNEEREKSIRLLAPRASQSQGSFTDNLRRYASLRLRISTDSGPGGARRSAASAISIARSNRPAAA